MILNEYSLSYCLNFKPEVGGHWPDMRGGGRGLGKPNSLFIVNFEHISEVSIVDFEQIVDFDLNR